MGLSKWKRRNIKFFFSNQRIYDEVLCVFALPEKAILMFFTWH